MDILVRSKSATTCQLDSLPTPLGLGSILGKTRMNSYAPLILEPLADRSLKVSAIAIHFDPEHEDDILSLASTDSFAALTAAIPCVLSDNVAQHMSGKARERLQRAGCHVVDTTTIMVCEKIDQANVPVNTRWFGGHWYLAPSGKPSGNQSPSRNLEIRLLQLVANEAETRDIEAVFRQDPILSYHLLRIVNSIGTGTNRNITSFSQAILILGRQQLKRWLNLMLFSTNRNDHRSAMLLAHVTVRARTMELLAKSAGLDHLAQEQAFMAGMFSLLGILFSTPIDQVIAPLKLSKGLSSALLERKGDIGKLLHTLDAAENIDAQGLAQNLSSIGITIRDFNALTVQAHHWMLGVINNDRNND